MIYFLKRHINRIPCKNTNLSLKNCHTNQSEKFVDFNGIGVSMAVGAIIVSVIFTGEPKFCDMDTSALSVDFIENNVGIGTGDGDGDNDVKLFDDSNFLNVKDPLKLVFKNWILRFSRQIVVPRVKN